MWKSIRCWKESFLFYTFKPKQVRTSLLILAVGFWVLFIHASCCDSRRAGVQPPELSSENRLFGGFLVLWDCMLLILFKIFLISFLINLVWEISHSVLYDTCLKLPLKKYTRLIIWASIKDGFWVSLFYIISFYIFNNINILTNYAQLLFFVIVCLIFAFII